MKIWEGLIKISKKYSADEMELFKKTFPDFSESLIDKLYYSSIELIDSLVYFDETSKIIFETQIYHTTDGFKMLMPSECKFSPLEVIELKLEEFTKQMEDGNIDYLSECMVPFPVGMEFKALVDMRGYFFNTGEDGLMHKEIVVDTYDGGCSEGYIKVRNELGRWFEINKEKLILI